MHFFLKFFFIFLLSSNAEKPIENFMEVSEGVFSGAQPKNERSFYFIKQKGIKTIISVDGQVPNIKLAKKYGLNYLHIPIGYDEVPIEAQKALLKTLKTRAKPYFIHCHHGKHRGPAAAAILFMLDGATNKKGLEVLKKAGTSHEYRGLWKSVESFSPKLTGELPNLQEVSPTTPLVTAMIMLDSAHYELKKNLTRESLIYLKEGFLETKRILSTEHDEQYREYLDASLKLTEKLILLKSYNKDDEITFKQLSNLCKKCHKTYRN
ncbi:MAG: hypothetical protein NE334_03645 [Lentisphaeraceae bacterium]|nr:hypothetical protein [Lentisphaeraceae bacterium]